eukprot:TRINITY_DN3490_c0_g1_i1.p1 TRINITY_DN3490_c0_g1~~TRINITY_DN3490_c0_g1_i1.p1  ORF type:complete len:793 (-),score=202.52 TRINITY_DN3490_c0_g1_i1:48-2426(-)
MVHCKNGQERMIAAKLMQKYLNLKGQDGQLYIYSVLALDQLKGTIYVEADKSAHVKEAITGIMDIFMSKDISMVPPSQMSDLLKISTDVKVLPRGSWVRVTRGKYKGDLAQVESHEIQTGHVEVKLVPRLDLDMIIGGESRKRKRTRPPAKFLNPAEVKAMGGDIRQEFKEANYVYIFNGETFKGGYLIKSIPIKSLNSDGVVPSLDEHQKFQNSADQSGENDRIRLANMANIRKVEYQKGDRVLVVKGELEKMEFIVHTVDEDVVKVLYTGENKTYPLEIPKTHIVKYFREGDHVKVLNGTYTGVTGTVINVDDSVATLISDVSKKELSVLTADIRECGNEVSSGVKLGNYELFDLVQLAHQRFGVIVKVDVRDGFDILDTNGTITSVKLQEIIRKKHARHMSAYDSNKESISAGDAVKIVRGDFQGQEGNIKHIFRHVAFVHSRSYKKNNGVFAVDAKFCNLKGTSSRHLALGRRGHRSSQKSLSRPRAHRNTRRKNSLFLHKTVQLNRGQWKGYLGLVKDTTDKQCTVELQTNAQRITVPEDWVTIKEIVQDNIDTGYPIHPAMTPMHQHGRTPNTPIRTPNDMPPTPNWTPGGAKTPGEDNYYGYLQTPEPYSQTPHGITSPSPRTPLTPRTPISGNPTTPGMGMARSVQTPGVGTPGFLPTPNTPYGSTVPSTPHMSQYEPEEENILWTEGIQVIYNDRIGVITNMEDTDCAVQWNDDSSETTVSLTYLKLDQPNKGDNVIVVRGDNKGSIGELTLIDQDEAIVTFADNVVKILPIPNLAKYIKIAE